MNSVFGDAQTEHILTGLFEKMPLIGICLDLQGNITYANPYFYTVTGYTKEDVIGKNWFSVFIPKQMQQVLTTTFQDIIAKNENTRFENPVITKAGDIRLISWTNMVMAAADGAASGTVSIGEDVTDLKRAEESLIESEENFRILSEIAQEGIVIHENGIILLCNQKFADMGGYTVPELTGKNVMDFFPPESADIVKKHMNDEVAGCYTVTGHRKDGSLAAVEICSKKTMYRGKDVRVATIRETAAPPA